MEQNISTKEFYAVIGRRFRAWRERAGLSSRDLAGLTGSPLNQVINLENGNTRGTAATRLLARLVAAQRFDVNRLFVTGASHPAETGARFYPVMTKAIERMLKDPGLEADIFNTLDAAKELLQPGNSPADPGNGSDDKSNGSAHKSNSSDGKSNGSAHKSNSSDHKSNGSDDKSNSSDGKSNGSDGKSNSSDHKSNGSDDKSNSSDDKSNGSDDKSNGSDDKSNSSRMNRSAFAPTK